MDISNETKKVGESIIRGKAMKQELSYQIDTVDDQEFFHLIKELDDNSQIEFPERSRRSNIWTYLDTAEKEWAREWNLRKHKNYKRERGN